MPCCSSTNIFLPLSVGNFRTHHWDENVLKQSHLWEFSGTLILNIWAAFFYLTTLCSFVLGLRFVHPALACSSLTQKAAISHEARNINVNYKLWNNVSKQNMSRETSLTSKLFTSSSPSSSSSSWQLWYM